MKKVIIAMAFIFIGCQSVAVFVEEPPNHKLNNGDELILEYTGSSGDSLHYVGTINRKGGKK